MPFEFQRYIHINILILHLVLPFTKCKQPIQLRIDFKYQQRHQQYLVLNFREGANLGENFFYKILLPLINALVYLCRHRPGHLLGIKLRKQGKFSLSLSMYLFYFNWHLSKSFKMYIFKKYKYIIPQLYILRVWNMQCAINLVAKINTLLPIWM